MELSLFLIILYVCGTSALHIIPELKHNILRFGYRVIFRYEGMLSHSFDRLYVVTKIEIPTESDLNLTLFQFHYNCSHVVNIEKGMNFKIPSTIKEMFNAYCKNIIPYLYLYKYEVEYYERTVYDILEKDTGLLLPRFEHREKNVNQRCQKRQIISALISGFIGLAFEGISWFLQHKQVKKALQEAMHAMNKRVNKIFLFGRFCDYLWCIQCRHIREINTDGT